MYICGKISFIMRVTRVILVKKDNGKYGAYYCDVRMWNDYRFVKMTGLKLNKADTLFYFKKFLVEHPQYVEVSKLSASAMCMIMYLDGMIECDVRLCHDTEVVYEFGEAGLESVSCKITQLK